MSSFKLWLLKVSAGAAVSAISAAAIMVTGDAKATDVKITISGPYERTATFVVPENPIPNEYTVGSSFELDNISTTLGTIHVHDSFEFFNGNDGGGVHDRSPYQLSGSQYYSGSESAPTFIPGVYTNQPNEEESYAGDTVSISAVTGVPEPASWALSLVGIAALGGTLRVRRSGLVGTRAYHAA